MSQPKYLYHFTSTRIALEWILKDLKIKMNDIKRVNDSKENLLYITNSHNSIGSSDYSFHSLFIANSIQKRARMSCFSVDKKYGKRIIRGYERQRMWAQYGQINSGICICVDYKKFIEENNNLLINYNMHYDYVKYINHNIFIPQPLYGVCGMDNSFKSKKCDFEKWEDYENNSTFIYDRFFTKNPDWRDEAEFRFLAFTDNENLMLSIKKSIKKIILGPSFPKKALPLVLECAPKTLLYYLMLDESSSDLIIRRYY